MGVTDLTVKGAVGSGCGSIRASAPPPFDLPGRIETGYEPYLSFGLRGAFHRRADVALGACFQYNHYFDARNEQRGTVWRWGSLDEYYALVEFKDRHDFTLGLTLDLIGDWGLFYISALYNKAVGKALGRLEFDTDPPEVYTSSADIEVRDNMGASAGLRIIVRKGWYVMVEGQYKLYRPAAAISVSVNKAFGL